MIVQVSSSGCLVRIAQLHDTVAREQHWSRSRASSRQPRRSRLVKLKMPWPIATPCMYYCPKATNKKTGGPAAILRDIGRVRSTWEIKLPPAATWTTRRGCVFARSACSGFFFFFCRFEPPAWPHAAFSKLAHFARPTARSSLAVRRSTCLSCGSPRRQSPSTKHCLHSTDWGNAIGLQFVVRRMIVVT